jgi:hypothetical protein
MTAEMGRLVLFLLAGAVLGAASLATLRLNTALYLEGRGVAAPIGLHLARLAVIGTALVFAAKLGADVLLAMAVGFALARPLAMKALARRTP